MNPIKIEILKKYSSLKEFTDAAGMNYSTVYRVVNEDHRHDVLVGTLCELDDALGGGHLADWIAYYATLFGNNCVSKERGYDGL